MPIQPIRPFPMLQPLPQLKPPTPVQPTPGLPPLQPTPGGPGGGGGGLGPLTKGIGDPFGYLKGQIDRVAQSPAVTAAVTSAVPPLSMYTHHLGDAKPMADQALGFIQNQARDPARFGALAAGLAPGLTRGVLNTGPAAFPLLLAGHGLLGGGQTLADLRQLAQGLTNAKPGGA